MGKKVSRNEAANILGCHPQTVSNYATAGLINEIRRPGQSGKDHPFYDEDQLKALSPELTSLTTLRQRIAEEQTALAEELKALEEKKEAVKEERLLLSGNLYRVEAYRKLITDTWAFAFREYPELENGRYRTLIDSIVEGKTLPEISKTLGVSNERCRQLLTKMGNQLAGRTGVEEVLERYQQENWELAAQVKVLKAQIEAGGNSAAEVVSSAMIPLKHCGLGTRSYNVLHVEYGFSTLGEVTTLTEEQLRKTRNFGRKGLAEVTEVLHRHGLQLKEY